MLSEMNQTQKHTYDFTYMRHLIWINTQSQKAEQVLPEDKGRGEQELWLLHSIVNALKAARLHTLKWLKLQKLMLCMFYYS